MRVALFDLDRRHTRWVDMPDKYAPPQVILVDGVPYVYDGDNEYRLAGGVHHVFSNEPCIDMAKKFTHPVDVEANSTRWYSGCVGEAKIMMNVDVALPWFDSMRVTVTDRRAIRVHGVWSPDCEDKALNAAGRQASSAVFSRCRLTTNTFCCEHRPPNSKLILTLLGVDLNGRIVCEIHKHLPPIGSVPGEVLSLRKHLLESGLFTPAKWRLP